MARYALRLVLIACLSIPVLIAAVAGSGDAEKGKAAFTKRCKMCHGADGKGNPAMARMLKVEFKAMDSEYIQQKKDQEIKKTIVEGKGKMVAVKGISDSEVGDIIAYVRSLSD